LVRSKLEYASVAWNSFMITDSNRLEHIQIKLAALCHSRLSQDVKYHYDYWKNLNLLILHVRRIVFNKCLICAKC
jgi:hypothetical protein